MPKQEHKAHLGARFKRRGVKVEFDKVDRVTVSIDNNDGYQLVYEFEKDRLVVSHYHAGSGERLNETVKSYTDLLDEQE